LLDVIKYCVDRRPIVTREIAYNVWK